jgi:ATP-dependent Clp protease ATP-binding subunit ClpB
LKRAIERHIVYPLANLLATEQVHLGDLICIDWNKEQDRLLFVREGENLAIPVRKTEPVITTRAAQAKSGKSIDAPSVTLNPEPTPRMAR